MIERDLVALNYEARLSALVAAKVGLWDVVAAARRRGSSDAAIRDSCDNDVAGLVATLPRLRAVAFNGGTAAKLGVRLLAGIDRMALVPLPSSSPLYTVGLDAKLPAWRALQAYLHAD